MKNSASPSENFSGSNRLSECDQENLIITLLPIIIAQFDINFLNDLGEVGRLKVESGGDEATTRATPDAD